MSVIVTSRQRGLGLIAGLGLSLVGIVASQPAVAKTQAELEQEVLSGAKSTQDDSTALVVEPNVPPSANSSGSDDNSALLDDTPNDPKVSKRDMRKVEDAIVGPKRVPRSQILVVQRKYIEKTNRHEIIPFLAGVQLSDSFRRQVQWGFGYAYHVSEMFGIEVLHANVITNYATGLNEQIKKSVGLFTDRVEPVFSVGSSLQFTPLRSKAAAFASTVYFEGFFLAGGGATRYETTYAGMAMAGVGFRVYLTPYAILKTEFRNYTDFRKGERNNRFNILTGASVLFGSSK